MQYAVRVVLVLAVVTAGVVLPGTAAQACRCLLLSTAQQLDQADAVFAGQVARRTPTALDAAAYRARYDILVTRVFKGEVDQHSVLTAAALPSACGVRFSRGEDVLIFANDVSGASDTSPSWSTSLCSGSKAVTTDQLVKEMKVLGAGERPAGEPAATDALGPHLGQGDEPNVGWYIAWTVLGLIVIGAAAAWITHAIRFRRLAKRE